MLILILIWAFAIAPAAKIVVGVHTSNGGFSGNATFTDKLNEENPGVKDRMFTAIQRSDLKGWNINEEHELP